MSPAHDFDVIIVGGGIAGSSLAGVLARAGLGVLVVEKEEGFRDRIRGEGAWPWGVAEAHKAGLDDLLGQAGTVKVRALVRYENQRPAETEWELAETADTLGIGFLHPNFQEAAFCWAGAQGASTVRPAKVTGFHHNGRPTVSIVNGDGAAEYSARLIVGADGKHSMTRRWTGGESESDPGHHRMGGVLISGATYDRERDNYSWVPGEAVNWFAAGAELTRLYLLMSLERLRETGVDRSFEAILTYAADHMPEGATRIAGNGVALIGDAAGSPDPSHGHGTALIFHDVRALSERLLERRS